MGTINRSGEAINVNLTDDISAAAISGDAHVVDIPVMRIISLVYEYNNNFLSLEIGEVDFDGFPFF